MPPQPVGPLLLFQFIRRTNEAFPARRDSLFFIVLGSSCALMDTRCDGFPSLVVLFIAFFSSCCLAPVMSTSMGASSSIGPF